jgi:putative peptidoglycan lipid II flippase
MMWAPIANNVVSVLVLVGYLVAFGPAGSADTSAYSSSQELLLGLGSTVGIAIQLLVLLPYLRAAGFRYRPRFDFRGSGLGHTLRLGLWTVLFVVVNQIAYLVVVRLAARGAAEGLGGEPSAGYTVYSQAFLLVMVPHAIATVSLATAVLPRLSARAAEHDLAGVGDRVASTLRTALTLIVPFSLLLPVLAYEVASIVYGWGAASQSFGEYVAPLSWFALGLVFFTVHYLMLRGYYALERTRTVFWVQCVIAAVNIALALALTRVLDPALTPTALVLAYSGAYAVGACLSYLLLRHLLGGLRTPTLVRFLVRVLLAAAAAAGVAAAVRFGLQQVWPDAATKLRDVVVLVVTGLLDVTVFLLMARLLRIEEVTALLDLVRGRLRGRGGDLP